MSDAQQQPSVGRMVHVVGEDYSGDPACHAAVITYVPDFGPDDAVYLTVFRPDGVTYHRDVRHGQNEPRSLNTWHWPERV
jgi:hypothetical protein